MSARRFWRDSRGAAAIELALATPVVLTLIFGTFELGWAFMCGSSVRHAVETSSRALISTPGMTSSDLQSAVQSRLANLPISGLTVTVSKEWLTANVQVARVSWTYQYLMTLPYVPTATFTFDSNMVVPMATG